MTRQGSAHQDRFDFRYQGLPQGQMSACIDMNSIDTAGDDDGSGVKEKAVQFAT